MSVEELFNLHTKAELAAFACVHSDSELRTTARKSDWLHHLQQQELAARPYQEWNPEASEAVWRLAVGDIEQRLRLMFFGNLHQEWSEFVLADLGIFQYESVALGADSRAFRSREDVDCYLRLHACRQALDEGQDLAALLAMLSQCLSSNAWLEQRRAKVLLRMGQACERARDWPLAQQIYTQCSYPGARHRRMRVHEQLQQFDAALALAQQAQQAPESEEESQRVARMLPRLLRKLGQPRLTVAAPHTLVRTELLLATPSEPQSVEFVVRAHWHVAEAPVYYVENTLINSLFGLLCWDAIFAPLPGAFFHPFQRGPADLYSADFVARRKPLFDACLAELDNGQYRYTIMQRFAAKAGLQSPFVFWESMDARLLQQALSCIPAEHLKLIFERLLADLKANRTGLPDLLRLWPQEQRYELVEIKGPGDQLQDNQIRWLQYFAQHGIPASVCHVRWSALQLELGEATV